ncbi:MAG: UDP-N-acetylmuramate dehydrogenase [Bacteroidetes bacterium]|nr:UDP-N-acetylmuramate dehydrogenase [Bacteroidota bacterium]
MNLAQNISLKNYNSFGIEVYANYFSGFSTVLQLQEALDYYVNFKAGNASSILILGGGSNILFTKNYEGLVLKNELEGIEVVQEDDNFIYVKAGAGVGWHQFVLYCIQNNFAGVENLSLIPGKVGASPMQNIGAYGVEIKDVFYTLEAYHLQEKNIVQFTCEDCNFGYRESVFKNKYKGQFAILSVTYRLNKTAVFNTSYGAITQELDKMNIGTLSIKGISQAVINIRSSKLPDPAVIGNAGSFFKNPEVDANLFSLLQKEFKNIVGYPLPSGSVKLAAGWLIEQCGWKGYRKADAGCFDKQALVLVNYGKATGKEIYELSEAIIASVKNKFNVLLQREVNIF